MKILWTLCLSIFLLGETIIAQTTSEQLTLNAEFDQEIRNWIDFSVPIISCKELAQNDKEKIVLLDARELNEYKTSHIPGAKHIGYNKFDKSSLDEIDKNAKIVVYCSIGYRSEKIGEKLKSLGFNQVYNLYGSIFEWANQGNALINSQGNPTKQLHTYNRKWSKWVDEKNIDKRW